jgi:hypothetical protein
VVTNVSKEQNSSTFTVGSSFFYLEDGVLCSTKILVPTGYNNPKYCSMDLHCCENLKGIFGKVAEYAVCVSVRSVSHNRQEMEP